MSEVDESWEHFIHKELVERDGDGAVKFKEKATYRLVKLTREYAGEEGHVEVLYDHP